MKRLRYIDLFAGIGGFHQAMSKLEDYETECVFASEINESAAKTYQKNYGINALDDITIKSEIDIPKHDILLAGFPCQSFSKAGYQNGLNDTRGTLFFDITRILEQHKPKFIVLENVRNLVTHDGGYTWEVIKNSLLKLGYRITKKPIILSPHFFGIPQLRERVYIVGIFDPENIDKSLELELGEFQKKEDNSIYSIIDDDFDGKLSISETEEDILNIWNEFYQGIDKITIGFPIWFEYLNSNQNIEIFPDWKQSIIDKNRELYRENSDFINKWKQKHKNLKKFIPSYRKFEWQAGGDIASIWEGVIQFRPSGIRVKRPDTFPALVAMVHVPIIGRYRRRLSVREVARLQSFPENFIPDSINKEAYKQFGNAVNVDITHRVIKSLLRYHEVNYK